MTKFDSIVDNAVKSTAIESLRQREREITEDIEFLSRLLAGEYDEPAGDVEELDAGDETEADADADEDDDWFYGDDVRLFEGDGFEEDYDEQESEAYDYDEERSFETESEA